MPSFSSSPKNESLKTCPVGTQLRPLLIEAADLLVAPRSPLRLCLLNVVVLGLPFARNCRTLSPFRGDLRKFFLEKPDSMPFSNTMVPSRSSPRIANAFFALLHDSHAKRPARCERLRCLHRDSAHWASARCFVKATEPRDTCNDATSLSCSFRVKRLRISSSASFASSFARHSERSQCAQWLASTTAAATRSSTVPLRENTSFLHGPRSLSQPLCLRKNTVRPRQLKERGVNVTAADRFSATLFLRDHGPGLRKRLHFLRATFCSNLEFWHPHTTTLLGVPEFLQICGFGRQLAFRSHQRHFGRSA